MINTSPTRHNHQDALLPFVTFEFEIVKCNAPKVREVMKT